MMNRHIPVLVGPTASGKTEVSLHLAKFLGGEILSADSRQIYRYLDIGTAKPTMQQRSQVPHHFIDIINPDQEYNAGTFGVEGRAVIDDLLARKITPVIVGGSGLYIRSLIDGLFDGPPADAEFRKLLEIRLEREGIEPLMDDLRRIDPDLADEIDRTKPRRVIRALEVHHLTGTPLSRLHRENAPPITFVPLMFGIAWQRDDLYARIEQRCDAMLAQGLMNEVEELENRGYHSRAIALNTVGYAEVFDYRLGKISYEDMIRLFKQNSRRYAKRQLTWFRRDERIEWLDVSESSSPLELAGKIAESFMEKVNRPGNFCR
ncbi:MAG: tRNA (adenosine(37)-N6)-dimethylallyltransferase MiaA [Bacteroidota bacterium]